MLRCVLIAIHNVTAAVVMNIIGELIGQEIDKSNKFFFFILAFLITLIFFLPLYAMEASSRKPSKLDIMNEQLRQQISLELDKNGSTAKPQDSSQVKKNQ